MEHESLKEVEDRIRRNYSCESCKAEEESCRAPKISIIMPVYNTSAEYLEECLDSVFAQTFTDFELICVDDASDSEMTANLIHKYKSRHDNMHVIRLERRSGAGAARNAGFSYAESEYVIFLDADDIFAKDFLKEMYRRMEENRADFCICGHTEFHNGDRGRKNFCKLEKEKIFNKKSEDWLMSAYPAPWNKLCRRKFLSEHNIYFQSLSSYNDMFFHWMCMICAKSICILEKDNLIFYRLGTNGQISANRDIVNLYKAALLFLNVAPNYYSGEEIWNWTGALLIRGMLHEILVSGNEEKSKEAYSLLREFFEENPISFENRILQICKNNILQLDYESNWHSNDRNFLWQLKSLSEEIESFVGGYRPVYLWGRGKRGDAFQQFCKEKGIVLSGVTDIKDSDIGGGYGVREQNSQSRRSFRKEIRADCSVEQKNIRVFKRKNRMCFDGFRRVLPSLNFRIILLQAI